MEPVCPPCVPEWVCSELSTETNCSENAEEQVMFCGITKCRVVVRFGKGVTSNCKAD